MTEHAEQLLSQLLIEQKKTNDLLVMLIDALTDESEGVEDEEPRTYLDGSKVR